MIQRKKLLIGGQRLIELGSSRGTNDTDYLIFDETTTDNFSHDAVNNIDYVNGNGHKFFGEIWEQEKNNAHCSPQSILELKCFSLVQHCLNQKWQKADDCEYDIKFLVRKFNLKPSTVKKHVSRGGYSEIQKIINSVK